MGSEDRLSRLKEENAKLLNQNKKLEAKLKSLENRHDAEFINNISHEMRIPAQGINAISKGLVHNWDNFEEATKFDLAKKIAANAGRLYSLIDNLIEIPNIKKGFVDLKFSKIKILALIQDLVEECENFYINGKYIEFKIITNINPEDRILVDPNKITQLLRNILTNSIKATESGKIIIDAKIIDKMLKISVVDQGRGIPKDKLDQLFANNIVISKKKDDDPGVGIGLSIASAIVRAHKGKIEAANNVGKGAKVTFSIPVSSSASKEELDKPENNTKELNIVIVDDEETCLLSMSMMLMKTSYNLKLYSSPKEALEQLKKSPEEVNLILLDIMMPELDGISFLKEIKSNNALKEIPVIMQSGVADMNQIDESLNIGATDFIRKPFSKEILIKAIENVFK